ncbi:hypothetical protein GBF35_14950 [Nonomuraea phyllanthi]|uniref:hypothetical protein n=1 Tax=Nonomuraea phyllanthi TaxID=2219224 RepID=UPI001292E8E8|nr:hypothetical protein [Nonomuraea phyllanthi]QFY07816.1 hypothetical protein GBF35_14950 [Nonomuraea phyllanthi]
MERDCAEARSTATLIAQRTPDPACVTWCSGLDVEQVARCSGADPESETPMTITGAEIEHDDIAAVPKSPVAT